MRYFVFSIALLTAVVVQCKTEVMLPRKISYPLCAYCCDGTAMVLDGGKRSLKILSPDFKKVTRTIPLSIGQGPGELSNNFFSNPGAILLFKDAVVICDKRRRKINFYDFGGVFRDEIQFRKPVTTMRKKNGSIIVFFQNNGRLPPVTFSQQIDEESKKVMKTTIVNQQLSIIKTVSGAQAWSDNFFCLKQNGDFIMLNDEGTIITVGENGKVVDKLQLPVKGEEKVSVEDNTVSFETLGRFNSMRIYKGTIFLTYVQTDPTSHNNTTFLYRASGKEITKESFKGSVKKLAGILNDQLILFDKDKESILRIPLSETTKK